MTVEAPVDNYGVFSRVRNKKRPRATMIFQRQQLVEMFRNPDMDFAEKKKIMGSMIQTDYERFGGRFIPFRELTDDQLGGPVRSRVYEVVEELFCGLQIPVGRLEGNSGVTRFILASDRSRANVALRVLEEKAGMRIAKQSVANSVISKL